MQNGPYIGGATNCLSDPTWTVERHLLQRFDKICLRKWVISSISNQGVSLDSVGERSTRLGGEALTCVGRDSRPHGGEGRCRHVVLPRKNGNAEKRPASSVS